jgi:acetolactate synthase-1/2/3 large subunit
VIVSQIPRELVGKGRGYLHELPDQLASFAPVVKWTASVPSHEALPGLIASAFRQAASAPTGPVVLEIPVDLLTTECGRVDIGDLDGAPARPPVASGHVIAEAARLLNNADRPVLWAGGGVQRAGAWPELVTLAERLGAPVATTYMGKGAIGADHRLSAGSCCDEGAFRELIETADVLVCVGTELGAETTQQYGLRPSGAVVQVDVAPQRLGATYPVLGVLGDAREVLAALATAVPDAPRPWGQRAVETLRRRVADGLAAQGRELETGLLASIGDAVADSAVQAWDMTILGYWAAAHHRAPDPRRFLYPLGSGTLGYAFPASLGAAVALPGVPVLAVVGDGGFAYGMAELVTARQYRLDSAVLVVDSGGYGILREYQVASYGTHHEVDLVQPDFAGIARASGVPVRLSRPEELAEDLAWALAEPGPAMVLIREELVAAAPTP